MVSVKVRGKLATV